jgi:hypothetical protein
MHLEMDAKDRIFKEGFKHGYSLAQEEPDLAEALACNKNEQSWFFQGMIAGQQEYEMMKIQDRLNEISKGKAAKDDKEIDKDR